MTGVTEGKRTRCLRVRAPLQAFSCRAVIPGSASNPSHPGTTLDQPRACRLQRACWAVRADGPAPSPPDIPGRQVKSTRAIGVERTCHGNHVIHRVVLSQTCTEEHAPQVNVVGNVAAGQLPQWLPE